MIFFKLGVGLLFFILGWIYLYKSNLVLTLNRIAREVLFNDRLVLLERKKLAILFFCLSFIALYMGITSLSVNHVTSGKNDWVMNTPSYLMYMAMQDYCTERYDAAIEKYKTILRSDPDNAEAMKRLAFTYDVSGKKKEARALWQKLLRSNPDDQEIRGKLRKN